MNKFVIVCIESYDQYEVEVAHPIETNHTKKEIEDFFYERYLRYKKSRYAYSNSFGLLDSGLSIPEDCLVGYTTTYIYQPPEVWEVEEWFQNYKPNKGMI